MYFDAPTATPPLPRTGLDQDTFDPVGDDEDEILEEEGRERGGGRGRGGGDSFSEIDGRTENGGQRERDTRGGAQRWEEEREWRGGGAGGGRVGVGGKGVGGGGGQSDSSDFRKDFWQYFRIRDTPKKEKNFCCGFFGVSEFVKGFRKLREHLHVRMCARVCVCVCVWVCV